MSIDSAFQRLREANPVPRPASLKGQSRDLAVQRATVRQRSTELLTTDIATPLLKVSPIRRNRVAGLAAALAVSVAGLGVFLLLPDAKPSNPVSGVFELTSEMPTPARYPMTLADGTVLVFGTVFEPQPQPPVIGTKVLRYDSSSRTFIELQLPAAIYLETATPLVDGRVLMAGESVGFREVDPPLGGASPPVLSRDFIAVLYDPTTGTITETGPPAANSSGHTAVRLQDGRVLLVGGGGQEQLALAQVFDPQTGTFSVIDSTVRPRAWDMTATLLADGRVLVVGGDLEGTTAEVYDPTTGTFTETGPMSVPRFGHTATLLADGEVLLAGGYTGDSITVQYATNGDLYDPATGTFTPTGPMQLPRRYHVAALLRDGRVLVAGGNISDYIVGSSFKSEGIADAEIFDPATNQFSVTTPMRWPRQNAGATVLPNGDVLIVGNENRSGGFTVPSGAETTAEIFR